jgi:hypothetical protein
VTTAGADPLRPAAAPTPEQRAEDGDNLRADCAEMGRAWCEAELQEVKAERDAAQAQVRALLAALRPFAEAAKMPTINWNPECEWPGLTFGDDLLRAALAAYEGAQGRRDAREGVGGVQDAETPSPHS